MKTSSRIVVHGFVGQQLRHPSDEVSVLEHSEDADGMGWGEEPIEEEPMK